MNYRDMSNTQLRKENCSVGMVVTGCTGEKYVLVTTLPNVVTFMSLTTFKVHEKSVDVVDVNFLSKDELRSVINLIPEHATFTDYELDVRGLKVYKELLLHAKR
jgi:hypothetical protein